MYTMRPAEFQYHRPTSVEEAVALLDDEARPLAGGHSLLPLMKLRFAMPAALVDLSGLSGLDGIAEADGGLRIGALATHASVAASALVGERCAVLAETAADIGDRQVRNRGTIGGSVAHADPAADYPTVLTALGATIRATGTAGERDIAAADFFRGVFETALESGELVTSVQVPPTRPGTGAVYLKHRHPASRYAVVGVAALVAVEGGACTRAQLVIGGVAGAPVVATAASEALVGSALSEESIAAAAERAGEALSDPLSDTYASGEYRAQIARVLARRALATAQARAA